MTSSSSLSMARYLISSTARALAREPRLLVIDEPAQMPNLGDRDRFYALLRKEASERKMTLLVASEEMGALLGVKMMMSIANGELQTTEERGTVVSLPKRNADGTGRLRR